MVCRHQSFFSTWSPILCSSPSFHDFPSLSSFSLCTRLIALLEPAFLPAQPTVKLERRGKNLPLLTHEQRSHIKQQSDPQAMEKEGTLQCGASHQRCFFFTPSPHLYLLCVVKPLVPAFRWFPIQSQSVLMSSQEECCTHLPNSEIHNLTICGTFGLRASFVASE